MPHPGHITQELLPAYAVQVNGAAQYDGHPGAVHFSGSPPGQPGMFFNTALYFFQSFLPNSENLREMLKPQRNCPCNQDDLVSGMNWFSSIAVEFVKLTLNT